MVAPTGGRTGVKDCHYTAIRLSADGTAKALPQFDLHFRHDFSLDITVQIAVLLPHGFSQRVGYLKWQLHNDEQGDHISGEIHTFPARSTGEQDGVGKLFEAFQIDLWVALCLQHRHRELIFQFFIDTAHLIVGSEQHQRVSVGGVDQILDLMGHAVRILFGRDLLSVCRWKIKQTVFFVSKWRYDAQCAQ